MLSVGAVLDCFRSTGVSILMSCDEEPWTQTLRAAQKELLLASVGMTR